jgi:hypothetical protein
MCARSDFGPIDTSVDAPRRRSQCFARLKIFSRGLKGSSGEIATSRVIRAPCIPRINATVMDYHSLLYPRRHQTPYSRCSRDQHRLKNVLPQRRAEQDFLVVR